MTNRIYFEVLSSVLFGIAATLISLASYNLSRKQYQISTSQHRIAAAQLEPHFVLEEVSRNEDSTFGDSKWLVISNIGAPVYNVNIKTETFLQIRFTFTAPKTIVYLPIIGSYDTTFRGNTHIGQLAMVSGYQNQEKFLRFHEQEHSAPKKPGIHFRDLTVVTRIDYQNQMREHGQEFFVNTARVSDNVARKIVQWGEEWPSIVLDELDMDTVYTALEPIIAQLGRGKKAPR